MSIRALLSSADGSEREVDLRKETIDRIRDHELLWIDITGEEDGDLRIVRDALKVDEDVAEALARDAAGAGCIGPGQRRSADPRLARR